MKFITFAALSFSLLTACAAPDTRSTTGTPDTRWALTGDGLGAVTREALVSVESLQDLYPELRIAEEEFEQEGETYTRIVAFDGAQRVFEIEPADGRFRDIVVLSPRISDASGARVGAAFKNLPIADEETCFDLVDASPYSACPSKADDRLQYLFRVKDTEAIGPETPLAAMRVF